MIRRAMEVPLALRFTVVFAVGIRKLYATVYPRSTLHGSNVPEDALVGFFACRLDILANFESWRGHECYRGRSS